MPAVAAPGRPELVDVFRVCGDGLEGSSAEQRRVARAITSCRTAALGGHVRECDQCGHREISYNSCRNRHCPKCQGLERVRWQEAQAQDLLPVPYFHVVFTVPAVLDPLFLANLRLAYGLLFEAVAQTLQEVAQNPKNLGATVGFTAVLHTWTQTLLYHPHVHCIVPGGGLDPSGTRWVAARRDFFLPVRVLSHVLRGKLLGGLERALEQGRLTVPSGVRPARLLQKASRKKWVVYSKRPVAGPEQVLSYLGRYTHRIAIGNERLVSIDNGEVTFRYQDRANGNRACTMTLDAAAFVRRFLLHVLPTGFVRVRHYGLLANATRRDRIATCRRLLGVPETVSEPEPKESWVAMLLRLTGKDVTACPSCGTGRLHVVENIPREGPHARIGARGPSP